MCLKMTMEIRVPTLNSDKLSSKSCSSFTVEVKPLHHYIEFDNHEKCCHLVENQFRQ